MREETGQLYAEHGYSVSDYQKMLDAELEKRKQLTEWMREQGVIAFTCEGLSVQFHPRAIKLPAHSIQGGEQSAEAGLLAWAKQELAPKDDNG